MPLVTWVYTFRQQPVIQVEIPIIVQTVTHFDFLTLMQQGRLLKKQLKTVGQSYYNTENVKRIKVCIFTQFKAIIKIRKPFLLARQLFLRGQDLGWKLLRGCR